MNNKDGNRVNKHHSDKNMLPIATQTTTLPNNPATDEIDLLSRNKDLAEILGLISSYYVMARDTYRAKSFATASANIAAHPLAITSGAQARRELPGIGESIAAVIDEYMANYNEETETGTVQRLRDLELRFSDRRETIDLFRSIYGIGPVTAVRFYDQGFRSLQDLWERAQLTDAQRTGILWRLHIDLRIPRNEMDLINQQIGSILDPYQIRWNIAGSYRREETSSGDIDVLVESRTDLNMDGLMQLLQPHIVASLAQGPTKFMGIFRLSELHNGHRIDIRLIESGQYGAALMYFTGSQRFNILMRQRAIELGMTLNEYGLFYTDGTPIPVNTEEDIFNALRVAPIPPVQRTKTLIALQFI